MGGVHHTHQCLNQENSYIMYTVLCVVIGMCVGRVGTYNDLHESSQITKTEVNNPRNFDEQIVGCGQ